MNPIIVMAMWGRRELVRKNLEMLDAQVIVASSLQEDFDFLRSLKVNNLQILPTSNRPLGAKWQHAVDAARLLGADPLIILGSDDFLSAGFVAKACHLTKDFDFIYFDKWYIFDTQSRKSYALDYQMARFGKPPLGSGRIYSKKFLDAHSGRLFDNGIDSRLDDYAWDQVNHANDQLLMNPDGMAVLAVKGPHEQLNPLSRILASDAIKWSECAIDQYFNFSKPIKEIF